MEETSVRRLLKNSGNCHPEEPKARKGLCICIILQMQGYFAELILSKIPGFLAPLRMTSEGLSMTLPRSVSASSSE